MKNFFFFFKKANAKLALEGCLSNSGINKQSIATGDRKYVICDRGLAKKQKKQNIFQDN